MSIKTKLVGGLPCPHNTLARKYWGTEDTPAAKLALDEYAEEEFDIELDRRQTLTNMEQEFISELDDWFINYV